MKNPFKPDDDKDLVIKIPMKTPTDVYWEGYEGHAGHPGPVDEMTLKGKTPRRNWLMRRPAGRFLVYVVLPALFVVVIILFIGVNN